MTTESILKEPFDTFSNLADTKGIDKQVLLFTEENVLFRRKADVIAQGAATRLATSSRAFHSTFDTVYG